MTFFLRILHSFLWYIKWHAMFTKLAHFQPIIIWEYSKEFYQAKYSSQSKEKGIYAAHSSTPHHHHCGIYFIHSSSFMCPLPNCIIWPIEWPSTKTFPFIPLAAYFRPLHCANANFRLLPFSNLFAKFITIIGSFGESLQLFAPFFVPDLCAPPRIKCFWIYSSFGGK